MKAISQMIASQHFRSVYIVKVLAAFLPGSQVAQQCNSHTSTSHTHTASTTLDSLSIDNTISCVNSFQLAPGTIFSFFHHCVTMPSIQLHSYFQHSLSDFFFTYISGIFWKQFMVRDSCAHMGHSHERLFLDNISTH